MKDYTVTDRVHSQGYAEFLAAAIANSWVAENCNGDWEVRVNCS